MALISSACSFAVDVASAERRSVASETVLVMLQYPMFHRYFSII